jgi:hypothetical protein
MSKPVVGVIGLGLMGSAIAQRLIETGHTVAGYDIVAAKLASTAEHGVRPCGSPAEVVHASDIVLMSVTSTKAVEEVVLGTSGVVSAAGLNGKILVDHSTTEINTTERVATALKRSANMVFVDAPVSGGPAAAASGTLAIMAGGEATAIACIRPVMEQLGKLTHMGSVGAGQATKLVNQTLVLTNYCVLAEALRLASQPHVEWGLGSVPCSLASRRSVPHGEERAFIGTDVNAEGLSFMSMKVRERATAPRQMTTAIIAPTTSPQVVRSSIRGSCVFMVLSYREVPTENVAPPI